MHDTNKLGQALRTTDSNGTAEFLRHRSAIRKTMVRILADIANSDWTLQDDHALDQIEGWLRDRMSIRSLPRTETFTVHSLTEEA